MADVNRSVVVNNFYYGGTTNIQNSKIERFMPTDQGAEASKIGVDKETEVVSDSTAYEIEKTCSERKDSELNETQSYTSWNENESDLGDNYRAFQLEEKCSSLMTSGKHKKALPLLHELLFLQENKWTILKTELIICECLSHCDTVSEVLEQIGRIRKKVMTSLRPKIEDVMTAAENYRHRSLNAPALILLQCASELCMRDETPDEAVIGIKTCCFKASLNIKAMLDVEGNYHLIASEIFIPSMRDMLKQLRVIKADDRLRVENEAKCCNYIGFCYNEIEKFQDSISICTDGIQSMEQHFGKQAFEFYVVGDLFTNIGFAKSGCGKQREAVYSYQKAIKAYQSAVNCPNSKMQQDGIDRARRNLQSIL